jgi:hypothetical protein
VIDFIQVRQDDRLLWDPKHPLYHSDLKIRMLGVADYGKSCQKCGKVQKKVNGLFGTFSLGKVKMKESYGQEEV